jgi:hypothetical protein
VTNDLGNPDFRSDPMESPEGKGIARRAWQAYARRTNQLLGPTLRPLVEPSARKISASLVTDLFGFWLTWHLEGGFDGLLRIGMSRSAIYRRIKMFRSLTGMHPDEFVMPGVDIDVRAYRKGRPSRREA